MSNPPGSRPLSYLDNASTSHPKPAVVVEAMGRYLTEIGASPSRGSHALARAASAEVKRATGVITDAFGIKHAEQLAFTSNATHALNLILKGALRKGDHVVATVLEHNAVLRPLEHLKRDGVIDYDVVGCDAEGNVSVDALAALLRPTTRMVAVNHGSNVLGTITPLDAISQLCADRGIHLLVDVAQTAGFSKIDADAMGASFLAFTGHKKLLGPSGIGGAFVRDPSGVRGLMQGGTGGNSNSLIHPENQKFEVGTSNYLGIVGLAASIEHVMSRGLADIRSEELELTLDCAHRLSRIPGVTVYGGMDPSRKLPIVSFNVHGMLPGDVGYVLDEEFGVMVRTGVHCAPLIHRAMGTFPHGSLRISLGFTTTQDDIDRAVAAVDAVARGWRNRPSTHPEARRSEAPPLRRSVAPPPGERE